MSPRAQSPRLKWWQRGFCFKAEGTAELAEGTDELPAPADRDWTLEDDDRPEGAILGLKPDDDWLLAETAAAAANRGLSE